jgi:hypothetical protein
MAASAAKDRWGYSAILLKSQFTLCLSSLSWYNKKDARIGCMDVASRRTSDDSMESDPACRPGLDSEILSSRKTADSIPW